MSRHLSFVACLLFAFLASTAGAETEPAPTASPSATQPAAGSSQTPGDELAELPEAARVALAAGRVVLLETTSEDNVLATRLVAVIESRPEGVVDALRDYQAMAAFPEVRRIRASKGEARDTFELTVKPHPLLPPMDFTRAVEWSLDGEGAAHVGISLLSTTSAYVADQQADYRILPLDAGRSLVFYEARSTYAKLSFRQKVLKRLNESSVEWLEDVQGRAAAQNAARQSVPAGAFALLSTGAVSGPLR